MTPSASRPPDGGAAFFSVLRETSGLMGEGRFEEAIARLLSVSEEVRGEPAACNTLAFLFMQTGRPREAVTWFEAAIAVKPDSIQAIKGLGAACLKTGELDRALKCYEIVASVQGDEADVWYQRALVLIEMGRLDTALESLERASALDPNHIQAVMKRSEVLESLGDTDGALDAAAARCQMTPGEATPWFRLGTLLQKSGRNAHAIAAYDRGLEISPREFTGVYNKALALKEMGSKAEALAAARQALEVWPDDREALLLLGGLELAFGHMEAARACFLKVAGMGVVRRYPAVPQPAKFRALMLFSPVAGNTPYEDLIEQSCFDAEMMIILPGHRYDAAALDGIADVVVNLVAEPDRGLDAIAAAAALIADLPLPVINHPRLMPATDRETIARTLADVPATVMPVSRLIEPAALIAQLSGGAALSFPLIVRHAGLHGGEMMELAADAGMLRQFAAAADGQSLYLTDFVDYRSPDGFFRKYRFVFVGEDILPYHLAIGDGWKVHHQSTRMAEVEWMRQEEEAFLNRPDLAFGAEAMAALDIIRRRVGLDYFGIDCSLDRDGKVVVFEVNATMLIHLHNEGFEYKTPHVHRIKRAFESLLERRAREKKAG